METQPIEAQLLPSRGDLLFGQNANDDRFAERARQDRDAEIHRAALDPQLEPPVLRDAAFRNVQLRHDFDPGDHRPVEPKVQRFHRQIEDPIDAILDFDRHVRRLDVDVAGSLLEGGQNRGIDEPDDGAFVLAHFFN